MAIVMTINNGPGKGVSRIDDSCVVKTQEEVDRILENCWRIYMESEIRTQLQREQQKG